MESGPLETRDLRKEYRSRRVLNGLSFQAVPGAITLLAGRNGAGKTTWMRIALGLARSTAGHVWFAGKPLQQVQSRVAAVFDEAALYPNLSGLENLQVISGGESHRSEWAERVLQGLGLDAQLLRRKGAHYSFGQRKRIAIAGALLRKPRWLLLDEPTVGVDPMAWDLIQGMLQELAHQGSVVLLTSQDFEALEDLVQHVVVMGEGTTIYQGTALQFKQVRPARVLVQTTGWRRVLEEYPHALFHQESTLLEIPCSAASDAETVVGRIQDLKLPLQRLEVCNLSLEEAFRSVVKGDNHP